MVKLKTVIDKITNLDKGDKQYLYNYLKKYKRLEENIPIQIDNAINQLLNGAPEALDTLKEIDDALNDLENCKSVTYTELVELRNNSELIPGKQYRITDYVATTVDVNSRSANHPFDIIVTALTNNTLSEEAFAAIHDGDSYFANNNLNAWKIWYTLDNDSFKFTWADSTNGKGVIYRLIDEYNNDLPYDFKGIQFKRWKVKPKTKYNEDLIDLDNLYIGGPNSTKAFDKQNDYLWFYTFNICDSDIENTLDASLNITYCRNNKFEPSSKFSKTLNNNVIISGEVPYNFLLSKSSDTQFDKTMCCIYCKFDHDVEYNTVFGNIVALRAYSYFKDNIIVGSLKWSSFDSNVKYNLLYAPKGCQLNVSTRQFIYNNIFCCKGFVEGNSLGKVSDSDIFVEDMASYNNMEIIETSTIKCNTCRRNTIFIGINNNIKCNVFSDNHIKGFENNIINSNNDFAVNMIDMDFTANTINDLFTYNDIGPLCKDNTFSGAFSGNRIQYNFKNNIISKNVRNSSFNEGQITYCTFNGEIIDSAFYAILSYIQIPDVVGKKFSYNEVKSIRGTSQQPIVLDYSQFFISSLTNVQRRVIIEGSDNGEIVATWKGTHGSINGVYKLPSDVNWTNI